MSDEHLKVRTVSKALMEMITSRLLPRLVVHKCTQNLIRPNKDLIISIRVMYVSKHKGRYRKSIPTLLSASCFCLCPQWGSRSQWSRLRVPAARTSRVFIKSTCRISLSSSSNTNAATALLTTSTSPSSDGAREH